MSYTQENKTMTGTEFSEKVKELHSITSEFLFIEYYPHTGCDMWKIINEYTNYAEHKLVLCSLDEGIEKAIDLAIDVIKRKTYEF